MARNQVGVEALGCAVADINDDGMVDGADIGAWLVYAGEVCDPGEPCPGDLDGDGEITGGDLGVLLVNWGPCPE